MACLEPNTFGSGKLLRLSFLTCYSLPPPALRNSVCCAEAVESAEMRSCDGAAWRLQECCILVRAWRQSTVEAWRHRRVHTLVSLLPTNRCTTSGWKLMDKAYLTMIQSSQCERVRTYVKLQNSTRRYGNTWKFSMPAHEHYHRI